MAHPQLVTVFGLRRLGVAAGMRMHVDDAGHDVGTVRIDLARRILRAFLVVDRQSRITDRLDLGDTVVLYDDIHRPDRRGAATVDQCGAADNQPCERSLAFAGLAVRRRYHLRFFVLGQDRQGNNDHRHDRQKPARHASGIGYAHIYSPVLFISRAAMISNSNE